MPTSWTVVKDYSQYDEAIKLARGTYQRDLLRGRENLSGSTLKGKARTWSSVYAKSRDNLLKRLAKHDIVVDEVRGDHNKRILVIG